MERGFLRNIFKKAYLLFKRKEAFSSANLQAILDTTVDAIITISEKACILSFNKTAEKMFGYSRQEVIGENVHILMPEPFHSQHDTYIQNYLKTGQKKIIGIGRELVAKRKDGSLFPIDLAVSEICTGSQHVFTGIIRDITERKKAEEEREKNIRMEAEMIAKNEYISILVHELRTPLTAIYSSLELLIEEKEVSFKVGEYLEIANRNAERLVRIVNDVLDVAKIQAGKLKVELGSASLMEIVNEAIVCSKPIADKTGIQLVVLWPAQDITVFTDGSRLVQVLLNLFSNAIKFSPKKGKVTITMGNTSNQAQILVQDQGKGIPEEFYAKIFTPFSQAAISSSHSFGGTGLGLHICKNIMEQLGGEITFSSKKDEGTTFCLHVPIVEKE